MWIINAPPFISRHASFMKDKSEIKFAFFGTDEFSVTVLEELQRAGFVPTLIITAPDAKSGRGMRLSPPPVKVFAQKNNLEFIQPQKLEQETRHKMQDANFDMFVAASYGKIIPEKVLDIPKHGSLNVHPSLLPLYRGPSPIQSQILGGAKTAGVTIMLMDKEVDHGPILAQQVIQFPISDLGFQELRNLLAREGGILLADTIPRLLAGDIKAQNQEHEKATYTKRITKESGQVDLEKEPSEMLWRKFRAFTPWPGIYFFDKDGKRVKITDAEIEGGRFIINKIIPEGKKEMAYNDFLRLMQ